jgi:hypothetical protein
MVAPFGRSAFQHVACSRRLVSISARLLRRLVSMSAFRVCLADETAQPPG